jgi:hypothetical protein
LQNSTVDLHFVLPVKSTVEILPNFAAFSEHMNFNKKKLKIEKTKTTMSSISILKIDIYIVS